MRTKTRARARFPKPSGRLGSATTSTARPLPSPIPDYSSNAEEENVTDRVELDMSSENDGRESNISSDDELVNTCLKCNGGGNVLICSGIGCAIRLHDECIPRKPKYDEDGNFYCPYCWYKIHQTRAQELKKIALLAKNALRDFMDYPKPVEVGDDKAKWGMNRGEVPSNGMDVNDEAEEDHQNDKNVNISDGDPRTEVADHENFFGIHECEVLGKDEGMEHEKGKQVADQHDEEMLEGEEQEDPLNTNCIGEEIIIDDAFHGSAELKSEALKVCEGNRVREEEVEAMHKDAPAANGYGEDAVSDGPKLSDSDTETLAVRLRSSNQRSEQNAKSQKKSSIHSHNTSAEEAREQNEKVSSLKKNRQPQTPAKKLTNFSFSHEKRKRLHWGPEEEEMLREGVQKFSTAVNKNLPWRKILEFGRHVFNGSRTPADLKDKWRNIVAKESSMLS